MHVVCKHAFIYINKNFKSLKQKLWGYFKVTVRHCFVLFCFLSKEKESLGRSYERMHCFQLFHRKKTMMQYCLFNVGKISRYTKKKILENFLFNLENCKQLSDFWRSNILIYFQFFFYILIKFCIFEKSAH